MKILYVRHGKSMANAEGTIAVPSTPLVEEGFEQARKTGRDLRNKNVTAIVCSPFLRAKQTAETIASELGISPDEVVVINELRERGMGELEGILKQRPSNFFVENDTDLGFESQADLIARLQTALEKVKKIAAITPGTTVVVGHAAAGLYFLQIAKGKRKFEEFDTKNQIENAEVVEVELV